MKTYGHLRQEHSQAQAMNVKFAGMVVGLSVAAGTPEPIRAISRLMQETRERLTAKCAVEPGSGLRSITSQRLFSLRSASCSRPNARQQTGAASATPPWSRVRPRESSSRIWHGPFLSLSLRKSSLHSAQLDS